MMHKNRSAWRLLFATFTMPLIALNGCSNGGGGNSLAGGTRAVDLYVTDNFRDDFRQTLITLYKVEASTDGSTFQTLFQDSTGTTLDVSTLRNSAQLLSRLNVTNTNFTQIRVTIDEKITIQPTGGGASTQITVDSNVGVHANGQVSLTYSAPAGSTTDKIVIDFDLAAFQLVGDKVRPSIHHGDKTQFDLKDHICRLAGVVSNLQAGASFQLNPPEGQPFTINLSASTQILASDTTTTATLANGQFVMIQGDVDTTNHTVNATTVTILPNVPGTPAERPGHERFAMAVGNVTAVDTTAGTLTLSLTQTFRFTPNLATLTVKTDPNTVVRKSKTETGQLSDITVGIKVAVGGKFDKDTGVLTAKFVMLNPPDHH